MNRHLDQWIAERLRENEDTMYLFDHPGDTKWLTRMGGRVSSTYHEFIFLNARLGNRMPYKEGISFKECPLCVYLLCKPLMWLKEHHLVVACEALEDTRTILGLSHAVRQAWVGARDEKEAFGRFWGKGNPLPEEEIVIRAERVEELRREYGRKLSALGF